MRTVLPALAFGVLGLALVALGGWLVSLGGSPFYAALGLGLLVTSALLFRRSATALPVYALILLASLGWAVWEVGFDWWQLAPRGGLLVLLGIWLWLPPVRRGLRTEQGRPAPGLAIGLSLLICVALAVWSMFQEPSAINGQLSAEAVTPNANTGATFADDDWHQYGRTPYGQRYSPLTQITTENVATLVPAWTFQTGDVKRPDDIGETTYQVTPHQDRRHASMSARRTTGPSRIDAATGQQKWKFDANSGLNPSRQHQTCRGVTYWRDPAREAGSPCAERIYLPTADARLIALDARSGKVCADLRRRRHAASGTGHEVRSGGLLLLHLAARGRGRQADHRRRGQRQLLHQGAVRRHPRLDIDTGALLWNWDSGNPDRHRADRRRSGRDLHHQLAQQLVGLLGR